MNNKIETAIRATVAAMKAELATSKASPDLQRLSQQAIEAAEKAVGGNTGAAQTRPRRPR